MSASRIILADPGPARPRGFDFTRHMRLVCADFCARLPQLSHIRPEQIAYGFCQTRKGTQAGLQAALTPMRFEGGEMTTVRRGKVYAVQRLFDPRGREYLYLLNFYLPRFLNGSFEEKLATVLHELWHVGERFDGDIRRFEGRCYAHSHSQGRYDAQMHRLVRLYLASAPPEELLTFLHDSFDQLRNRHGLVYGTKLPHPKLIPLPSGRGTKRA